MQAPKGRTNSIPGRFPGRTSGLDLHVASRSRGWCRIRPSAFLVVTWHCVWVEGPSLFFRLNYRTFHTCLLHIETAESVLSTKYYEWSQAKGVRILQRGGSWLSFPCRSCELFAYT